MTIQTLQSLIDKRDNFEIIGDQIAQILTDETANQRALAAASGDASGDWALRIYREVAAPWEFFKDPTEPPVVSVRFARFDGEPRETTATQQVGIVSYFLDFGAAGQAAETLTGHIPGDLDAARRIQRAIRLVRNILLAGPNQVLQARGVVGWRRVTMIEAFQPPQLQTTVPALDHLAAARVTLEVKILETTPEYEAGDLESIAIDLKNGRDGAILAQAEYDYQEAQP